jgi:uncharacterized tellurite resistance protein B-like protein
MLAAIRNFFDQHIANQPEESQATAERRAQIAAAALLVEVARSDQTFSEPERQAVLESVQRRFNLGATEARELLRLAETESREAHDIFQFTSKIDASFTPERKTQLIEELWRAAYSDGKLHEYEEHLIRRVCDLLHISHSGFIAAKLRVLASLEPGSAS